MSKPQQSHESFSGFAREKKSSERAFGLTVGGILALIAFAPVLHHETPRIWLAVPALGLILVGAWRPHLLKPLNALWMKLGLLLGMIISPIVMSAIYFLWVTPYAFVVRLMGKRLLDLDMNRESKSYWIARQPVEPNPAHLRRPY